MIETTDHDANLPPLWSGHGAGAVPVLLDHIRWEHLLPGDAVAAYLLGIEPKAA